jgi:Aminoarabinose transferase C-terminal domain
MVSTHWRTPLLVPYLLAGGPVLMATGWCTRRALAGGRPLAALGVLAVGWFAVFAVAVAGRGAANDYRALGLAARAAMGPDDRLSLYGHFIQGIGFYSGRRTIMVGRSGELQFGSQQGDQRAWFWPDVPDLRREWAGPGRLFLVVDRAELAGFDPPLDPAPIIVAAKDKKVLVVNR